MKNMLRKRFLSPKDIMPFGKNEGLLLEEIYKYEPTYIEWLIINTEDIMINIKAFESLPDPTPLAIGAVLGSQTRHEIFNSGKSLVKIMTLTDNVNMLTDVRSIKQGEELSNEKLPSVKFYFSEEAKKVNEEKMKRFFKY